MANLITISSLTGVMLAGLLITKMCLAEQRQYTGYSLYLMGLKRFVAELKPAKYENT